MSFRNFLKDKEALKGLTQISVILLLIILVMGLLYILYKSETKTNEVMQLLTFIVGTILGGFGGYMWGSKQEGKKK